MPIQFQPSLGQILICDFPKEFAPPEMVKRRPVVCVSPKLRNRHGVVTVVPLSTTPPARKAPFNVEIQLEQAISPAYPDKVCWAKCDMLYNFSYSRFSVPKLEKLDGRQQLYNIVVLPSGTMCEIFTGILAGLGIQGSVRFDNAAFKVSDLFIS